MSAAGSGLGPWHFLGIGTYNLACLLLGMGLGWWADAFAGSTPVLTLAGLAAGVAVGVLGTWWRVRPLLGGPDADEPNQADDGT